MTYRCSDLTDLGGFAYRSSKSLHLYVTRVERFDPNLCHCSSHYADGWGRMRPEMDDFAWTPFARIPRRCARHMGELLSQRLSLPLLLARLVGRPPALPEFVGRS